MRTAAKPAGKTILPSAETSVCFTSSHTHTDSTHNSLRFLSLRIFQNKDGVSRESGTGQTGSPASAHRDGEMERERALDGVLPDAKLHPRALHPLTCTLSLSRSRYSCVHPSPRSYVCQPATSARRQHCTYNCVHEHRNTQTRDNYCIRITSCT